MNEKNNIWVGVMSIMEVNKRLTKWYVNFQVSVTHDGLFFLIIFDYHFFPVFHVFLPSRISSEIILYFILLCFDIPHTLAVNH